MKYWQLDNVQIQNLQAIFIDVKKFKIQNAKCKKQSKNSVSSNLYSFTHCQLPVASCQ